MYREMQLKGADFTMSKMKNYASNAQRRPCVGQLLASPNKNVKESESCDVVLAFGASASLLHASGARVRTRDCTAAAINDALHK